MKPFFLEENKEVVFSMPLDKASDPDSFTLMFFQKRWDFVGFDDWRDLEESQRNDNTLKQFNITFIALNPKLAAPSTFSNFRPISLCNTIYKIITKAIANRFFKLIPKFISNEQGGFVLGRETSEGALIAHEILRSIKKHNLESVIIKLDTMKAYNQVTWIFLEKVFLRFGFSKKWPRWIISCILRAKFSALVNDIRCGFFSAYQGVRQGDPLSPYLFITMVEALSRAIRAQHNLNLWKGIQIPKFDIVVTHIFFSDDNILFGEASMSKARAIKRILEIYYENSCEKINASKSKIIF